MVKILKKGIDVPLKLAYYCIINLIQQNLERVGTVIKKQHPPEQSPEHLRTPQRPEMPLPARVLFGGDAELE